MEESRGSGRAEGPQSSEAAQPVQQRCRVFRSSMEPGGWDLGTLTCSDFRSQMAPRPWPRDGVRWNWEGRRLDGGSRDSVAFLLYLHRLGRMLTYADKYK